MLQENHEQQERQRHHEVGKAHQHLVGTAAHEPGGTAVEDADDDEEERRHDADEEGYPGAVHQPGKHVPPEIVRTQRMEGHLDRVPRPNVRFVFDQALLDGFRGRDDTGHVRCNGGVVRGFATGTVEGDYGVEIGQGLEVQPILEAHVRRTQDFGDGEGPMRHPARDRIRLRYNR